MERIATLAEVQNLFGNNFIGQEELKTFIERLGFSTAEIESPTFEKYSWSVLEKAAKEGYILILGLEQIDGRRITLEYLRSVFGIDPDQSEPCFYNQDWYLSEEFFTDATLDTNWYLIKKSIVESSRAQLPDYLICQGLNFPPAILCAYTFFAYYFARGEYLWYHNFVWNSNVDHNGDRIYVGKYHDVDGVNKNGFSIHRHLSLRDCYASTHLL